MSSRASFLVLSLGAKFIFLEKFIIGWGTCAVMLSYVLKMFSVSVWLFICDIDGCENLIFI